MSYQADFLEPFRLTPFHVDRILKGTHPGDLPVQLPKKFQLVVNRGTASALGIDVPLSALLAAEAREKEQTILEITSRIDMRDEDTAKRVESPEYQAILRKAFRDWAGAESEEKRVLIRNLLTNAAAGSQMTSDDVIKLFLDWIKNYSEFHFEVIGAIYNNAGITRSGVWRKLGRPHVREDSSEADLFRLLFRDLSTGGIIRQHRETDYQGNFLAKRTHKAPPIMKGAPKVMKSAFDDEEQYELTAIGQQFVHYAMTDVPPKLEFSPDAHVA